MKHSYLYLIFSLLLGVAFGLITREIVTSVESQKILITIFDPIGQVFLRLIFMTVVPIVFCGLVLGVYQLAQQKGLGRVVQKTLLYTLLFSTTSVLLGLSLVNWIGPGRNIDLPADLISNSATQLSAIQAQAQNAKSISQILIELVPRNPLYSATQALEGHMLSLMFFALFFGLALSRIDIGAKSESALNFFETCYETCLKIIAWAMKLAPLAIFSLVFVTTLKFGFDLLSALLSYVGVVLLGLLIQLIVVYPLSLKLFARRSPLEFLRKTIDVLLYAFATASSNATLPKALSVATEQLKLSPQSSRFVLTIGSTANQNGTALFEGVTVLFLAQLYNVDLSVLEQIQVVIMSILAGVGTAGVPGGSLPLILILLVQVGIPAEGLGLIIGVDRLLDMCRTAINVSGDLVIATLVEPKISKAEPVGFNRDEC